MSDLDTQHYINVRDLRNEIDNLEGEIDRVQDKVVDMKSDIEDAREAGYPKVIEACESVLEDLREEEAELTEEYNKLEALRQDIEQYSSSDDAEVINEIHFESHLKDWTSDVYGVDADGFPFCYINWDAAIETLQEQDYKTIDYDGDTFLIKVT